MTLLVAFSLGCGIGYGYLHRIPIQTPRPSPQQKPANEIPAPPPVAAKPSGDGFSEVWSDSFVYKLLIPYPIYVQKAVRILFIDKLRRDATGSDSIVRYLLVRGLLWCCIQWRHYRVDTWRHNNVDADAWRRQQRIARKTIGCVPK